jgi:probable HAF family extracellular repeat protein
MEGFTLLPGLNGGLEMDVHPEAVNDAGVVVGSAIDGGGEWRAFVWDRVNGMRDLEDLSVVPAGFNLEEAKAVNNNGWITARGFWGEAWGPERAVVFVPRETVGAPETDLAAAPALRIAREPAGSARITFRLAAAQDIRLSVFDIRGREIASLIDGRRPAGSHQTLWNGSLRAGATAASGVYFIRLRTQGAGAVGRFVRLK